MSDESRRYAVIGAGALGGFYGCRLQRAGVPVDFLAPNDFDHLRMHGWRIDSKDGDFVLPKVSVYADVVDMPPADVVLIGLKSTSNDHLPALLSTGIVKPEGVVIVLQNGIGIEERVAEIVGPSRVLGGCCFLCSNKIGPGHIHHLDYGTIVLGELTVDGKPGGASDRLRKIATDFQAAGLETQVTPDLRLARWKKLMWNIPFNGLSVILEAQTDVLVRDRSLRPLVESIMREVQAAARADGREIDDAFLMTMMDHTEKMTPYRPSMKIDFDTCRPLEVDAIFSAPLRIADTLGVAMPTVRSMERELLFLDRRNRTT
jgi:2-dehydropantoate 2-reductase